MFISMNWVREFVNLDGLDLEKLIRRFTLSTAEVEDIYYKGNDIRDVVVGQILSVENHPDSKKLHLLKVDVGSEVLDIVCGAPNVKPGMKTAVAKCGGRVPAGEINKATLAGFDSYGMCCSQAELGISDDNSGIWEITDDLENGTDILDAYPIKDIVFEVDNKSITNRPDLWGHYGIAREFSAITKRPLKDVEIFTDSCTSGEVVPVSVMRDDLVYRYISLKISGVTKTVSPMAMQIRLYYCGMRGINLLADLTNYVMLELGQPMHAFDARKIDAIKIGTPAEPFKFKTLDNIERDIDENTLMIYNNDTPVAVAGVMGGLDSEIVGTTDSVVLESANFDGVSVRKTSSRLALRTDASMRYEKILDPELTMTATRRFVKLLKDVDPGCYIDSKLNDVYVKRYPVITLTFDKKYVDRYTGIEISNEQILETLNSLGFDASFDGDKFTVVVPSWRATKDVTIKADIIEEITRIYGYDNFKIVTTRSPLKPVRAEVCKDEDYRIKDLLVDKFNLHEVHSYIWCDGKKYKKLGIDVEDNVRILNIASADNGTVRNSMIPTLLSMTYENKSYAPSFGIFEIGRVADGTAENGYCIERKRLGITLFDKTVSEKELYFKMLAMVKFLFKSIKKAEPTLAKAETRHSWQHPKNTAEITYDDRKCGYICTLYPTVNQKIDKNASIVCVEIDLDEFYQTKVCDMEFIEPSKFPSIDVDLSLIVSEGQRYADIRKCWASLNLADLKSDTVIDMFELAGVRSITVRLSFSSNDRTLSMEEIQEQTDKILENLKTIGVTLKV